MKKREISTIALQILAIFLIIQGINAIATVATYHAISSNSDITNAVNASSYLVFFILMGILLWVFSNKLSGIIVKEDSQTQNNEGLRINANDLQRILFSVVGLYFIGKSFPEIVSTLTGMIQLKDPIGPLRVLPYLIGSITELVLGLVVFLSPQGLVNLLKRIRHIGIKGE